jgi:hypothetical protein
MSTYTPAHCCQDIVDEFRKREASQDRIRERLTAELATARTQLQDCRNFRDAEAQAHASCHAEMAAQLQAAGDVIDAVRAELRYGGIPAGERAVRALKLLALAA